MRLETRADRQQQRLMAEMNLTATHERAREAQKAKEAWDDGFMRLCWERQKEIQERDAMREREAASLVHAPLHVEKPAEQSVSRLERKMANFLNGVCVGTSATLLAVWLLLLAAGIV